MTGVGSTEPAKSAGAGLAGTGAGSAGVGSTEPAKAGSAGADLWSGRADAYRESPTHAAGDDLDLVVAWCEPGPGVTVLDVATGGGHVARRLRAAGATVVTLDPAPGMKADTTASAEDMPFADGSFDAVVCRIAAHHFADVLAAVKEMARVARHRVVVCDNTFISESSEEADRLRDPSHVRNYSALEWHSFFELAGLEVADERDFRRETDFESWLERVGCVGEDAACVRALLGDRVVDGRLALPTVVLKGAKSG
jgi:SAM-dependent methyltransferase